MAHRQEVKPLKLVVLISGNGSNLQSIIEAIARGDVNAVIVAVISNRQDAYGLKRAQRAQIETLALAQDDYASRIEYDRALGDFIDPLKPDLIILAGYMRILSPQFLQRFQDRVLNIHPSLLPKYKGTDTHQRAINGGESEHGATVHLVTEELDGGPIIAQAWVKVEPDDTPCALQARVLEQEHVLYPKVIGEFANKRLRIKDGQIEHYRP